MRLREHLAGWIAAALLLALVVASWWAAEYTQRAVVLDPPQRWTHEPDAWAQQFFLLRTDAQGVAINRLEGQSMKHYPDDDSSEIQYVNATLRQDDAPLITASADVAILHQDNDLLTLRGNARVLRQASGEIPVMQVDSETLTLAIPTDVVSTDAPAIVRRGSSVMRGTGMVYHNRNRMLLVHSKVDVRVATQDNAQARP